MIWVKKANSVLVKKNRLGILERHLVFALVRSVFFLIPLELNATHMYTVHIETKEVNIILLLPNVELTGILEPRVSRGFKCTVQQLVLCASCQFFLCFMTDLMKRPKSLSFFRFST